MSEEESTHDYLMRVNPLYRNTVNKLEHRNGCHDHEPYKESFGSYGLDSRTGDIRYFEIKNPNKKECQYQYTALGLADKGCTGCKHKDHE